MESTPGPKDPEAKPPVKRNPQSSTDRVLSILDVFSAERPSWSVEALMAHMGLRRATVYRYVKSLVETGFLSPSSTGSYVLGPRFIEFDCQIRHTDPLLLSGRPIMEEIRSEAPISILCSYYRDKVLCIHKEGQVPSYPAELERGRPIQLFYGPPARVILAHLPVYQLRNLMLQRAEEIRQAGLGADWKEFQEFLRKIRRDGYYLGTRQVSTEPVVGISAPVFRGEVVVGSLSIGVPEADFRSTEEAKWAHLVKETAARISGALQPSLPDHA